MTTDPTHAVLEIPDGFMKDPKGRLVPEKLVKDHELLEDQLVDRIIGHAVDLSATIGRFKGHCFADVAEYLALLAEKYGKTKRGVDIGGRGNVTLTSYDGTARVQIQIQDQITFGPGLQVAKALVDECLVLWSEDARPELRVLVTEAFQTDKEGQVSRERLFSLLRFEIEDPTWARAMEALRESIRVHGSKTYIRLQHRDDGEGRWRTIPIDLASAEIPEGMATTHVPGAAEPSTGDG